MSKEDKQAIEYMYIILKEQMKNTILLFLGIL